MLPRSVLLIIISTLVYALLARYSSRSSSATYLIHDTPLTPRTSFAMAGFKNADGTVNMEGLNQHIDHLKGKYAQNTKNYKANTGKDMPAFGVQDSGVQGSLAGQSAGPAPEQGQTEDVHKEPVQDTRAEGDDAPDASEHDERKN